MDLFPKLAVLLLFCAVQTQAGTVRRSVKNDLLNVLFKRLLDEEKRQQSPVYATCELQVNTAAAQDQQLSGTLHFKQEDTSSETQITGDVFGFSEAGSLHGFHIHISGNDADNNCNNNGGHYNPFDKNHGAPTAAERHVGDLGNIAVCKDGSGRAPVKIGDVNVDLSGDQSVIGRSIVIHAGEDDLGLGGDEGSLATGNARGRLACCTITQQANPPYPPPKAKKCPPPPPPQKRDELIERLAEALMNLKK